MERFKGTKGNWIITNQSKEKKRIVVKKNGNLIDIAQVDVFLNNLSKAENKANLQLISNSPEMLKMLIESMRVIDVILDTELGQETIFNEYANYFKNCEKLINKVTE